jgi:hypothetical protein
MTSLNATKVRGREGTLEVDIVDSGGSCQLNNSHLEVGIYLWQLGVDMCESVCDRCVYNDLYMSNVLEQLPEITK